MTKLVLTAIFKQNIFFSNFTSKMKMYSYFPRPTLSQTSLKNSFWKVFFFFSNFGGHMTIRETKIRLLATILKRNTF